MTLKIEAGKFYCTRDGLKVGPMVFGRSIRMSHDGITFRWSGDPSEHSAWADNGRYLGNTERARNHDLIEEWTDKPKALDLTAITTPDYNDGNWHGWNGGECPVHPRSVVEMIWPSTLSQDKTNRDTRQACGFVWKISSNCPAFIFRVVTPYAAPREGYAPALFRSAREAKTAHPGCNPVFVREVKE